MRRKFYFTEHALIEIDNDDLEIEEVMRISQTGTVVESYPDDKPYPSQLVLGWIGFSKKIPVHVVCAKAPDNTIHIVTAYKPSQDKWNKGFLKRKK